MTTTAERHASRLGEWAQEHDTVITTALQAYIEDMHKNSAEAKRAHDNIMADPVRRAAAERSLITPSGLAHASVAFAEAAERAQTALTSLYEIEEAEEEL